MFSLCLWQAGFLSHCNSTCSLSELHPLALSSSWWPRPLTSLCRLKPSFGNLFIAQYQSTSFPTSHSLPVPNPVGSILFFFLFYLLFFLHHSASVTSTAPPSNSSPPPSPSSCTISSHTSCCNPFLRKIGPLHSSWEEGCGQILAATLA